MHYIHTALGTALVLLRTMAPPQGRMLRPARGGNRGDVPGWVLITLMSAVLVAGLLAIAAPALEGMFQDAMSLVNP